MTTKHCECPICRRGLRITIEQVFEAERCWLGAIGIYCLGRLTWVTPEFFRDVLHEMRDLGILIEMLDHPKQQRHPIPIYMLARLTVPAASRKRGGV